MRVWQEAHDVWHAPVNRFEDMLDDGQANDVGAFVEVPGVSHKLIALCVSPYRQHGTRRHQPDHHRAAGIRMVVGRHTRRRHTTPVGILMLLSC